MRVYGWDGGRFYVNSATGIGRDRLEDMGVPVDARGAVSSSDLCQYLGTTVPVAVGRYAWRVYVQQHYAPRGEPLGKTAANELINETILPAAHWKDGVPWIERHRIDQLLVAHRASITQKRSAAGRASARVMRQRSLRTGK